jgi:hypothetical protein
MEKGRISVVAEGTALDCETAILVGTLALEEDGHVTMLSTHSGPQTKHEFYALAQMALFQLQEEELEVSVVKGPIHVAWKDEKSDISAGMAICRTTAGVVSVLAHGDEPWRKLLEAAHRYCTRWIRLDVP